MERVRNSVISVGWHLAFWGNGGLFRINEKFGGSMALSETKITISSFFGYTVDIELPRIDKIVFGDKLLYPYILIVLKNKQKGELNITYIIKPQKIVSYFKKYGIPCFQSRRSILIGFSEKELDEI